MFKSWAQKIKKRRVFAVEIQNGGKAKKCLKLRYAVLSKNGAVFDSFDQNNLFLYKRCERKNGIKFAFLKILQICYFALKWKFNLRVHGVPLKTFWAGSLCWQV